VCGREVVELFQGLCGDCFITVNPLIRVRRIVSLVRCSRCGSFLYRGRWTRDLGTLRRAVLDSLEVLGSVGDVEFEVPREPGLHSVVVRARGTREPLPREYTTEAKVTVRISEDLCPDCRDIVLVRERAVLQIRPRLPFTEDLWSVVMSIVRSEVGGEDRRGVVVDVERAEGGIDVKFNDHALARAVARRIRRLFPSRVVESQRVIKVSGGRRVTRLSISLQLLPLREGLGLRIGGEDYVVVSFTADRVKLRRGDSTLVLTVREILRRGLEVVE
jgi:nonsense-mediated mRNA decay protein 3